MSAARVAILMGSDSDWPHLERAATVLREFGVETRVEVTSAHRTPDRTVEIVRSAHDEGVRVFIAAAGGAAHLAGVVAAHTTCPVIGVPVPSSPLQGLDSLLSTVQMPPGIPVATVAIGGAENAALLAVQILALGDASLAKDLLEHRRSMADRVTAKSEALRERLKGHA